MTKDNTPSGETVDEILNNADAWCWCEKDECQQNKQRIQANHSLRQAIEGMVQEVIGNPLSVSELKPHAMSDAAAKKMRQGSELTVDAQLERAEVKMNKLFGKE